MGEDCPCRAGFANLSVVPNRMVHERERPLRQEGMSFPWRTVHSAVFDVIGVTPSNSGIARNFAE